MRTHPDVTVHDETDGEEPVEDGVRTTAQGDGRAGERDERGGEEALERPVVRAVRARGCWE